MGHADVKRRVSSHRMPREKDTITLDRETLACIQKTIKNVAMRCRAISMLCLIGLRIIGGNHDITTLTAEIRLIGIPGPGGDGLFDRPTAGS